MPATARMVLSRAAEAAGQSAADTSAADTARLSADVLGRVPLFAGLAPRQLRKIARLGVVARFDAKAPIVTEGDPGEAFYVILSGRATVRRARGRSTEELTAGAYFGEMALLDGAPRSATVTAESETVCLMLSRKPFDKIVSGEPAFARALLRALAGRVRELEATPAD